jgi:hypothetical protein
MVQWEISKWRNIKEISKKYQSGEILKWRNIEAEKY